MCETYSLLSEFFHDGLSFSSLLNVNGEDYVITKDTYMVNSMKFKGNKDFETLKDRVITPVGENA